MKVFAVLLVAMSLAAGICARGAEDGAPNEKGRAPILVELFTSEGCSSCPPADTLLQRMDSAQPVPGAQLIVLSEHVDYWDHDGWKDPYSSHLLTERQSEYSKVLDLKTVYTPQMIVDGGRELRGGAEQIGQLLQKEEEVQKVPVSIASAVVDAQNPSILRAHVEADGGSEKHSAEIYVAVALDHAESQVLRGENTGRNLTHVAVVQSLTKIGKLDKGKNFNQDIQVKLQPGTDPANLRLIAFVQESGPGKVLGAAVMRVEK
jgi:hypothetical protein